MRKLYLFAAMAAMLASCSSDDLTVEKQVAQQNADDGAVMFSAYVNRGLTRGGVNGVITTTSLQQYSSDQTEANKAGFGVFGYYTNGEKYSGITKPNFFYNEQVTYGASGWTYSPMKYWPNEFGSDAISDQVDRVTLFAYLPWVEVDPLTGTVKPATDTDLEAAAGDAGKEKVIKDQKDPTTNIIGMSRNNVTGDPFVKYVATMDATNSVDLCYGVAAEHFTSSNSALNKNDIKKGEPFIDVVKPGLDGKIKFDFKHATAQLKVTVDAVVNKAEAPGTLDIDGDYTRIWIRSVTFEGITQKGALNLNGGEWYDMNGNNKITTGSLTLFDGRKDGKEAILAATNETPSSINPDLIQSSAYVFKNNKIDADKNKKGVTKDPAILFVNGGGDAPVFVIPTNEKMKVTIVYDVETVDNNLAYYLSDGATQGSTIENSISKTIETFGNITAGYCYTLNLHLGMRTVDFEASVTEWQNMQANVDLPSNLPMFTAGGGKSYSVTLPAGTTSYDYEFALSGLKANEAVGNASKESDADNIITPTTSNDADAAGIAKQKVSVAANASTKNRFAQYRWTGATTGGTVLQFNQTAHTLDFTKVTYDTKVFTCTLATGLDVANMGAINTAGKVEVYRNGTKMTTGYTLGTGSDYTITLNDEPVAGDVFKIVLQANDAPAESQVYTIVTP